MKNRTLNVVVAAIFAACVLGGSIAAQDEQRTIFGWDLTYETLFKKNQGESESRLRGWLGNTKTGGNWISRRVEDWKGDRIVSSVLIEYPMLYTSNRSALWFVRTKKEAFFWEFLPSIHSQHLGTRFDGKLYDQMVKELESFKQGTPNRKMDKMLGWSGYYGILNMYRKGSSRQILLTLDDFYRMGDDHRERATPGRVAVAVDKVMKRIPAPAAIIFSTCDLRPTRKTIRTMFGDPVACTPAGRVCIDPTTKNEIACPVKEPGIECYRTNFAPSFQVRFNINEQIEYIALPMPAFNGRGLSRVIPTASFFGMYQQAYRNRKTPAVVDITRRFQSAVFEDDCVAIESRTLNTATNSINGSSTVRWK